MPDFPQKRQFREKKNPVTFSGFIFVSSPIHLKKKLNSHSQYIAKYPQSITEKLSFEYWSS